MNNQKFSHKRFSCLADRKNILVLLLCVSIFTGCSSNAGRKFIGHDAPLTLLTMSDGSTSSLSEYSAKDKVLIFWATWCPRSNKVLTHLNEFSQQHRNIPVIAVNLDTLDLEQEARERMKQYPYLIHAYSGNDVYDQAFVNWEGQELPYVAIINSSDKVVSVSSTDADVYAIFNVSEP